ncbi:bifunctional metallophosphatase/5'-nucleotidase [Caldimonas sp. KR1-144]|uniref:bifunctional metallophosphatase/5'-nucleotidase n=1 Tax=Caldimonas sp. KR1-144 TaxID=3400911 RepID=UPI003BFC5EDF
MSRRIAIALAASLVLGSAASQAQVPAPADAHGRPNQGPIRVKIVGFNDYHGNLQSPGTFGQNTSVPFAQRPPVGGADALAAYVARLKAQNKHNVVVGAGDFIGASPLISALFFDEPAVETLNRIGLEFNAVGNHEFDKGAAELLRLQNGGCKLTNGAQDPNSCLGAQVGTPAPFEGARFQWLSANVVSTATGRPLLPAYGVKAFNGVRIAFIGMTLKGTPGIVTPAGVAGLEFRDEADTVNALIPRLRRQGIEAIVVLVHQGGFQSAGFSDINGCDGNLAGSDLANIVSRLDNAVDLVISGHTHAAYNCSANTVDVRSVNGAVTSTPRPTGLPNAAGRLVPVTSASAFGRVLTDIDVTLDARTRDIVSVSPTNRLVDRNDPEIVAAIAAQPAVRDLVTAYNGLVSPIANQVIGSITAPLPNSADAAGNMPAGELIADSQLQATAPAGFGNAQIAFMNPGGVRNPGFTYPSSTAGEGDGNVTYGEAFTVQPFGNSLVTLTITAQNLKNVLEQQFAGCRGQANTRMLIPSAGFKYTWDSTKACDARITDVRLVNANGAVVDQIVDSLGNVVQPAKTYRVTVNNFIASGGDGFTTFATATSDALGGAQDIDALTAYLANFKLPAKPAYNPAAPELGKPRITRLP